MKVSKRKSSRAGFTLVELLVVIAIIGILAALVIPAVGRGFVRAKEFAINTELQQLARGIENFKGKFQVYPITDFATTNATHLALFDEYVRGLSRRSRHVNVADISQPNAWYRSDLPVPARIRDIAGLPPGATRNPGNIDVAEAYVFWLFEVTQSAEYPLGYRWDSTAGAYVALDNLERFTFFEFNETQFRDLDGDGWLEYVQAKGPPAPYIYFDSLTYNNNMFLDATTGVYPDVDGFARPYWESFDGTALVFEFVNSDSFQLIAAGLDGDYGIDYSTASPVAKLFDPPSASYLIAGGDRDNFANFNDSRLDSNLEN